MRRDMPLWWISEAEDEVSSLPQEAYEYKTKQGSHSLSSSFQDTMENYQRVSSQEVKLQLEVCDCEEVKPLLFFPLWFVRKCSRFVFAVGLLIKNGKHQFASMIFGSKSYLSLVLCVGFYLFIENCSSSCFIVFVLFFFIKRDKALLFSS